MPYFSLACSASRRLLIVVMPHHASHHTSPCLTHTSTGMACTCMADPPISLQSSRQLESRFCIDDLNTSAAMDLRMACTCMADPPISLQSSRPLSRQPSSRSRILHLTPLPFHRHHSTHVTCSNQLSFRISHPSPHLSSLHPSRKTAFNNDHQ